MKKILSFIIIILILVSALSISACAENIDTSYNITAISLRAGGGGSGGGGSGGGGSGGSGSGSSSHSDNSRPPTLFESIIDFIIFPFVFFSSTIFFYIKLSKRARKAKKLMKKMYEGDRAWKFQTISDTVEDSFYAIQTAWTNMDMTPAAKYMSDELFDSFQTKLSWMAYRNEKNVLEKISLLKALPVAVYDDADNSSDFVWLYIKGRMVDYIIDTNTQLKISGNTSATTFVEYWQFTRKDNAWVLNKILQKDQEDQIPFCE